MTDAAGDQADRSQTITEKGVKDMTEARLVMDKFMTKLSADEYKKENQPNNGPKISLEFIDEQLMSYSQLPESGIMEAALDEQR